MRMIKLFIIIMSSSFIDHHYDRTLFFFLHLRRQHHHWYDRECCHMSSRFPPPLSRHHEYPDWIHYLHEDHHDHDGQHVHQNNLHYRFFLTIPVKSIVRPDEAIHVLSTQQRNVLRSKTWNLLCLHPERCVSDRDSWSDVFRVEMMSLSADRDLLRVRGEWGSRSGYLLHEF